MNKRLAKNPDEELPLALQKVCDEIISNLLKNNWHVNYEDIYLDSDWGWTILATKNSMKHGIILRRIVPFQLKDKNELEKAISLQTKLQKDLIEVYPYIIKTDKNKQENIKLLKPLFSLI